MVAAVLVLCALTVVGRLVQLQLFESSRWRALAASVQERTLELPPRRGSILDRDGTPLAFDVKAKAIAVDGYNMTMPETLVSILAEELGRPKSELTDLVYRPSYFTWIDRRVELETAQRIVRRAEDAGALGLILLDTWKRCYPQGRLASNVIGFVGTDGVGLEGIELAFDDSLCGSPALLRVVEGADGRTYQTEVIDEGRPGDDVILTLNADLQFICEQEIERGVESFRAEAGMIVALDPATGEVLAMAQDKRYDLNRFRTSTVEARKNLAVSYLFEPGSIFKVFTGLAALEAAVVRVDDTFDGDDGIEISGHVMHNAENEPYGTVTFAETIEHSINTAMIRVAFLLGEDALQAFFARLEFGQRTGIELPGEEPGILRAAALWSPLDLAAASIGQSVAVTGVQLARAMAAVANGGFLPDVHIVMEDATQDEDGPLQVASCEAATIMRELMKRVVESGTGTLAAVDGFAVAGKTGTAQKAVPGRGYVDGKYTSLFAGCLPADDPEVVIVVVLDEVKTTPVWGGYTAGQIFREAATRMVHAERLTPSVSETYEARSHSSTPDTQPAKASGQILFGKH
ncbi:MAG: penicillin-binding protein 2 [Candidatus Bipolaricaulia bacterium]